MSAMDKIDLDHLLSSEARRTPEMNGLWEWIVAQDSKDPDFGRVLNAQESRAMMHRLAVRWNKDLPAMASIERFTVPGLGDAPPILVEMATPINAKPGCIVQLHGGGWAHGNLDTHQRSRLLLAQETGTRVLGVDYRMAPEHPFPKPLEDSQAAWRWVVQQSQVQPGLNGPLAVAGDSAGANLAAACLLRELQLGRPAPQTALLFYGIYGADFDTPSYLRFAEGFGLTREVMMRFFDWYVPETGPESARFDPVVSPLYASEALLARLPPLYLNAASLDVLLCDTLAFVQKLDKVGVPYELNVHEGVHHGFMQFSAYLEESRRAYQLAAHYFERTMRAKASVD